MASKVAPQGGYLVKHTMLAPVMDSKEAPIAEHVFSLLALSYTWWGGLNGTVAGLGGMETKAEKAGDQAWRNSLNQNLKLGIYGAAAEATEEEMQERQFLSDLDPAKAVTSYSKVVQDAQNTEKDYTKAIKTASEKVKELVKVRQEDLNGKKQVLALKSDRLDIEDMKRKLGLED